MNTGVLAMNSTLAVDEFTTNDTLYWIILVISALGLLLTYLMKKKDHDRHGHAGDGVGTGTTVGRFKTAAEKYAVPALWGTFVVSLLALLLQLVGIWEL